MAGAGERRKGGEVADDVAGRRFRRDAILRLPAQHLWFRPVGIVAQEAPGRGEVGVGLGRGPQDVPVDVARQQRIAEVRHHRARIGVAAVVDRLEGRGKGSGLGVAERLRRGDGLRHVALRRRGHDSARGAVIADRQRRTARSGLGLTDLRLRRRRPWRGAPLDRHAPHAGIGRLRRLIAALAAQDGDATLLGKDGCARQQAGEQDEGGTDGFHARNRRQVLAASQWQVRGYPGHRL